MVSPRPDSGRHVSENATMLHAGFVESWDVEDMS